MKPSEKLAIEIMAAAAQNLDPAFRPPNSHAQKLPKQIALHIMRKLCPSLSYPRLGQIFGVHHATLHYSDHRVGSFCKLDPAFAGFVDNLTGAALSIHGDLIDQINRATPLNYGRQYHGQPI